MERVCGGAHTNRAFSRLTTCFHANTVGTGKEDEARPSKMPAEPPPQQVPVQILYFKRLGYVCVHVCFCSCCRCLHPAQTPSCLPSPVCLLRGGGYMPVRLAPSCLPSLHVRACPLALLFPRVCRTSNSRIHARPHGSRVFSHQNRTHDKTFGLERLLAIFYTLVVHPVDASAELLAEISGLVSLGLVRKVPPSCLHPRLIFRKHPPSTLCGSLHQSMP